MSKKITRMSGAETNAPSYYITKASDGEMIVCRSDSECDKAEWTTFIDSYEDLVSMVVRESQAHLIADALNHSSIRDVKVIRDLRRTLLAHLGRDLFEGDEE